MERTTLPTYPLLISVKPIEGIVYTALRIDRAHPKIVRMPDNEVRMHEKHESIASVLDPGDRRSKILGKKNKSPKALGVSRPRGLESIPGPNDIYTAKSPEQPSNKEKQGAFRRMKTILKNLFHRKDTTKSRNHNTPSAETTISSGFHCVQNGCSTCRISVAPVTHQHVPITAPHTKVNTQDLVQIKPHSLTNTSQHLPTSNPPSPPFSFSSTRFSRSTQDLDIFPDFDGTHIESTPPQLDVRFQPLSTSLCSDALTYQPQPLRPISSFIDKCLGTVFYSSDDAWSSSENGDEDGDYTLMTTAKVSSMTCASSIASTLPLQRHIDSPTPCRKPLATSIAPTVPTRDEREWPFEANVPDYMSIVLRSTGVAAQVRRRGRREVDQEVESWSSGSDIEDEERVGYGW
jgi:hypothetical protein